VTVRLLLEAAVTVACTPSIETTSLPGVGLKFVPVMVADWASTSGSGVTLAIVGGPAALVAVTVKVAGLPVSPADEAVAVCWPALLPRVQFVWACPFVAVARLVGLTLPLLVANATDIPATGCPFPSFTCTTRGAPSACPVVPLWRSPETLMSAVGD